MSFHTHIKREVEANDDFRHVLFTGEKSQLVVMRIPPGGEIGTETHAHVEQTLYFQSGTGEATLDGETFPVEAGDVFIVTPGTKHNFKNTGTESLKVMTVYAPPNHIDGRIHHTKADADADMEDEAFGEGRV
jgi:mannose-6-phosphate isomerase-like protein (cupin superfamily)